MFLDVLCSNLHASLYRYPDVLKYLSSRSVTEDEIRQYRFGYSKIVRVSQEFSEDYNRFMDECWKGRRFENKVIVPITDVMGNNIGIIGRAIDSKDYKTFVLDEAKYTGFVFGLSQALPHIYKEKRAFVVEGVFDLYAFRKVFPNVVATLTSGIHEDQYKLLRRYCDLIITVFDSDPPGKLGEKKAKEEFINIRSVDIKYKDPGRALEVLGLSKFRRFVFNKVPF